MAIPTLAAETAATIAEIVSALGAGSDLAAQVANFEVAADLLGDTWSAEEADQIDAAIQAAAPRRVEFHWVATPDVIGDADPDTLQAWLNAHEDDVRFVDDDGTVCVPWIVVRRARTGESDGMYRQMPGECLRLVRLGSESSPVPDEIRDLTDKAFNAACGL